MWSICSCTIYVLSDFVYQNWTYIPDRRMVLISLVLIDKNKSWFTVRTGCLQLNQTAAAEGGEKTQKVEIYTLKNFHTMPDVLPQQKLQ